MSKENLLEILNKPIGGRLNKKDLSVFLRQFSALLDAGFSVDKCIIILKNQKELKSLKYYLNNIHSNLLKGNTLSESFYLENKFDDFFVYMISTGEETGKLATVTKDLSNYYEKEYEIERKLKTALIYPFILFITMIFVILFLFKFILPTFLTLFEENKIAIPKITKLLLSISNFVNKYFVFIIIFIFIFIIFMKILMKNEKYKFVLDKIKCKLPIIGKNMRDIVTGKISRSLYIITSNGIPIIKGIEIVSKGMENLYFKENLNKIIEEIKRGINLSVAFDNRGAFPNLFKAMIYIGDESGNIGDNLNIVSNYYEKETDYAVKEMIALFEPLMIIIMSLIVGSVVVAIALPMFELVNNYNIY